MNDTDRKQAEKSLQSFLQKHRKRIRLTVLVLVLFAVLGFVSSKLYTVTGGDYEEFTVESVMESL